MNAATNFSSNGTATATFDATESVQTIDRTYDVVRPIALGGMGCVLAARHRVTGRLVAVKVVRPELLDRADVACRVHDEAVALGRVVHPGIVNVVGAGICPEHGPYVATELLEGRALDGLLATRESLDVTQVVWMMRRVAAALRAVHRTGMVHRDVKPGNIFVTMGRDGSESIKLIDFGVVSFGPVASDTRATRAGEVLGTLCYMPPEQVLNAGSVDGRADLYSLGVSALECLGARRATNLVVRLRTPRPATALLSHRTDIPEALVSLLDDLLESELSARCPSADALIKRLDEIAATMAPMKPLLTYAMPETAFQSVPTVVEPAVARARKAAEVAAERPLQHARRDARAPFTTPIRITQGQRSIDGRSEDISLGGVLVTSNASIAIDAPTTLRINLPTTGKIADLVVRPRWIRQHGAKVAIGLEFESLDEAAKQAIATYVRWLGT